MTQAAWNEVSQKLQHRPKTGFSFPTRDWIAADMKTKERGLRGWARVLRKAIKEVDIVHIHSLQLFHHLVAGHYCRHCRAAWA